MLDNSVPVALTIAGSDNSAGAGVQADLKTFTAHGVYGLTAVTCVVAEIPGKVSVIQPVEAHIVREQIRLSLEAFPVAAVKTGMLYSREIIALVAEALADSRVPLVVDPVTVASSGDPLLQDDAVEWYRTRLFPLAALVTPNIDEARVLLGGGPIRNAEELRAAGQRLADEFRTAFLMKGGHLGGDMAVDILCQPDGVTHEFSAPFTPGVSTHGTGCTYSAAITAGLAQRLDLLTAVARAKRYVSAAIGEFFRWKHAGRRVDALRHWPVQK